MDTILSWDWGPLDCLARTHLQTCMSSFSSVPRVDFENLQQDLFADLARLLLSYAELEQRREELVNTVVELASSSAGPVQALGVRVGGLEPHRVQACANISAWIARCLAGGQNRGKSGRDKIGEPIHFYLVIKGKKNQLHNPPHVVWDLARDGAFLLRAWIAYQLRNVHWSLSKRLPFVAKGLIWRCLPHYGRNE